MRESDRIQFTAKQLSSGNLQVKFYIQHADKPSYGYLLIEAGCTEAEIRNEIKLRLARRQDSGIDLLRFTFKNQWKDDHQFYFYSA